MPDVTPPRREDGTMMKLHDYPITGRILLALFAVTALLLTLMTAATGAIALYGTKARFVSESMQQAELLAAAFPPVRNTAAAEARLTALVRHPDLLHAALFASDGSLITFAGEDLPRPPALSPGAVFPDEHWFGRSARLAVTAPLDARAGYLYLVRDASTIGVFPLRILLIAGFFSVLLLGTFWAFSGRLRHAILRPVLDLANDIRHVAEQHDFGYRIAHHDTHEIAPLHEAVNLLLEDADAWTRELKTQQMAQSQGLQNCRNVLRRMQNVVVEHEKAAVLGHVVSRAIHEVNVPLYDAISGSAVISKESKALVSAMHGPGQAEREKKLDVIGERALHLTRNLRHAADLNRHFERIAVDQIKEEQRTFDPGEYTEALIRTLHGTLKQITTRVEMIDTAAMSIHSYPGIFAQILYHLLINAVLHAFDEKPIDAKITISLRKEHARLTLTFVDNGHGMDPKIKDKAFEPFVTTLGESDGFGLMIVRALVTQKLGGTIEMQSRVGWGTVFEIVVPVA